MADEAGDRRGRQGSLTGFTLVEGLIAGALALTVMAAAIRLLVGGFRMGRVEAEVLGLQLDAQRSLGAFLRDLQKGMLVVIPQPGQTQPQAVVRDHRNRIIHYAPRRTPGADGLMEIVRNEVSPGGRTESTLIQGVRRVAFTALSDGALRIHLILGEGSRDFAFTTQIRMRNRDAAEG